MNMELTGKKINFLGDSITEGCCATSPEKGYVDVMKRKYRLTEARNYGIGGTRIARQRIPSGEPKFDDHGHGDAPMGTETDRTPDTFIGACHFLFSRLPNQFPGAIIVVLTPLHRMGENIPKGERGWLLRDYVRVIRDTAAFYGLPLLDLFETSVIRANDLEIAAKLTTDGLHPNDLGHEILAGEIGDFLKGLAE